MIKQNKKLAISRLAQSVAAITAITAGYSNITYAQEEESLEEIVVTGSRIRRQDFDANSPIVTVGESTFEETSTIGLDTILNQLPQFVPGMTGNVNNGTTQTGTGGSQFASGGIEASAFATPGTASVNLRGLGAGRNLILIDGRRGMPTNASMTVDINSIPSTALERIEIVSGGASATYGADAIAGAINFILKDNFEGMNIQTNYGITELGDAEEYRVSGLFGVNSADGRGNVMLGLEYSTRGRGDFHERDWYADLRSNPSVGGTDFFYSDTYISGIANFGNPTQQDDINALFPGRPAGTDISRFTNFFVNRTPDGTGTIYTGGQIFGGGDRDGSYKYSGPLTVDGFPFRKFDPAGGIAQNQLQNPISVPLDRYSLFGRGHYDITDDVSIFANVTFARTSTSTASQYSPAVGGWGASIPHGSGIFADSFVNPAGAVTGYDPVTGAAIYDPAAATNPAYLTGGTLGLNCPALGGCTNSQAFPMPAEVSALVATNDPNGNVSVARVLDFLGERTTDNTTMNYQFIVGLEGELDNGWAWDASLSHGESESATALNNFGSVDRYNEIAQSPNYGRGFIATGGFGGGAGTCTTGLPLFEDFAVSQDCIDTIRINLAQNGRMQQDAFDANITGDLFELPAGTLQFAAGVSFRANEYSFKTGDVNRPENFLTRAMGLFPNGETNGRIAVKELYGELLVPLVSDGPTGIREFSLEIGGRVSDYYNTSGDVSTYKALGDWLITDWMRFRGGFQRATRAPNIQELFTGRSQQIFAAGSSHGDVCSMNNFDSIYSAAVGTRDDGAGGTESAPASAAQAAQTLSLCRTLMGTAAADIYYGEPVADQSDPGGSGSNYLTGNPNVQPETADTITAGLVFTSPFESAALQGLSASIDWFDIEVEDMIATYTATTINERCFSIDENPTGDVNNSFCQLLSRNPTDGEPLSTDVTYTNESRVKLSGVDVQLSWNTQFADLGFDSIPGGLGITMLATIPLKIETQAAAGANVIDWVGYQGGGECPSGVSCTGYDYQLFTTINYFNGPFNASLRWQRYPSIDAGALATNPNSTAFGVHDDYDVFALTGAYRLNDTVTLSGGIENLFDTKPPLAGGNPNATPFATPATPTTGGIYDALGRRYFMSVNMSF